MRAKRLTNRIDIIGVIATLLFYLKEVWTRQRPLDDVHIAFAIAVLLGLSYRFLWRSVSPQVAAVWARLVFAVASVLLWFGWDSVSFVLLASANVGWLLEGASLDVLDGYAYWYLTFWLYLVVFLLPREADFARMVIAMGLLSVVVCKSPNPDILARDILLGLYLAGFLLFVFVAGLWLVIAPTAEDPGGKVLQRVAGGAGVVLLSIALVAAYRHRHELWREACEPDSEEKAPRRIPQFELSD